MCSTDETAEPHNDAKKPRTEKGEAGVLVGRRNRVLISLGVTALILADESLQPLPLIKPTYENLPLSVTQANPALAPFLLAEGLSSMETLLTNIQVTREMNRKCL